MKNIVLSGFIIVLIIACNKKKLPILGERVAVERTENGQQIVDTIYQQIPDFSLINQDSATVDQNTVAGKIYLADFFFTSCPTICPKVRKNLKKVSDHFQNEPNLLILSHSLDYRHDTVGRLAWYANKLNIDSKRWHLLHGSKEQIYGLAQSYLIAALEDSAAPGGYDHSSYVALIDRQRRIRGLYDGLDAQRMEEMIKDIDILLAE